MRPTTSKAPGPGSDQNPRQHAPRPRPPGAQRTECVESPDIVAQDPERREELNRQLGGLIGEFDQHIDDVEECVISTDSINTGLYLDESLRRCPFLTYYFSRAIEEENQETQERAAPPKPEET